MLCSQKSVFHGLEIDTGLSSGSTVWACSAKGMHERNTSYPYEDFSWGHGGVCVKMDGVWSKDLESLLPDGESKSLPPDQM